MMLGQGSRHGLALGTLLLAAGGMVGVALAQQSGGQELRFGLSQRFEASDNQPLAVTSPGSSMTSTTGLSFGYRAETAASVFQFRGSALLRATTGPGSPGKDRTALEDPSLQLSYTRRAATGEFGLSARATSSNIAFLRPFEDFLDPETGAFVPPDDLDDLTGTGRRLDYGANVRLRLGDQAPFGTTFRAGISGINYRNVTNPGLVDNRRVSAGVGLRFSLSPVTDATVDLDRSRYSNDNPLQPDRDTTILAVNLSHDRPDGRWTAGVSAEKRDGRKTRYGVSIGRRYDLVRGGLSLGAGLTWGDTAKAQLNGNLSWTHELPDGQISLGFRHGLSTGTDDSVRQTTAATFGWQHRITQTSSISVDMGLNNSRNPGTGLSVRNATMGLGYSHQLTDDWALSAGYRHRQRDSAGQKARSNTVFVTLQRDFTTRF